MAPPKATARERTVSTRKPLALAAPGDSPTPQNQAAAAEAQEQSNTCKHQPGKIHQQILGEERPTQHWKITQQGDRNFFKTLDGLADKAGTHEGAQARAEDG